MQLIEEVKPEPNKEMSFVVLEIFKGETLVIVTLESKKKVNEVLDGPKSMPPLEEIERSKVEPIPTSEKTGVKSQVKLVELRTVAGVTTVKPPLAVTNSHSWGEPGINPMPLTIKGVVEQRGA